MEYTVEINNYEGPLDLLLHLIKKSEVDIYDISIDQITKQYLNYINLMEKLNLNIASEYLVMAAELIEIKSAMLLPKKKEEATDTYEEDPRTELINRLLEYERYKKVAESLGEFESKRQEIHSKEPFFLDEFVPIQTDIDEEFNMDDLIIAFNEMLKRIELEKPLNTKIATKEYSITIRSSEIKKILKEKKRVEFTELFDISTRDYIVITFLSILNMAKKQELKIVQDKNFSNIILEGLDG